MAEMVASAATTSVARMTGFPASLTGLSLTKEAAIARLMTAEEKVVPATADRRCAPRCKVVSVMASLSLSKN